MFHKKTNTELVLGHLDKHFVSCYAKTGNDITTFYCKLVDNCWLTFPFYRRDADKHNPYDVVNAIWEYILTYML